MRGIDINKFNNYFRIIKSVNGSRERKRITSANNSLSPKNYRENTIY